MSGQQISISATEGGRFDCYVSLPASGPAPAVVIMSSIFGVDDDVKRNADDLAAQGYLAAAPDLFWRGDAGPMTRTEEGMRRARERAKQRDTLIDQGVQDLADVITLLKSHREFDGQVDHQEVGGPHHQEHPEGGPEQERIELAHLPVAQAGVDAAGNARDLEASAKGLDRLAQDLESITRRYAR